MSALNIRVIRGDGRLSPILFDGDDFAAAVRKTLETAQRLAVNGCPFGDTIPPRCVEVRDAGGALLFSIAVHASLKPIEDAQDR